MKRSIMILAVAAITMASGLPVTMSPAYGKLVDAPILTSAVGTKSTRGNPPRPRGSVKAGFNATSALDASIGVGASGALSWSMAIRTPIGPGDSGPEVKIFYTGQRHGILGYGMAVSGLGSSIRRCNSTHQIDGFTKRFDWQEGDALCLDGARLILDSNRGGEYGSSSARYGVMGQPNVYVEARFRSSDMPGSAFAVYYPSGRVDLYGYRNGQVRDDALVYGVFDRDLEVPYSWHVSRSIDPSNNLTDYNYVHDDLSDKYFWPSEMVLDKPSHRLKEIKYGGLKVDEAADLPHSRRVDLIYETVNEVVGETDRVESGSWNDNTVPTKVEWMVSDGFVGGVRYRNRHVLSAIGSYAAGVPSWGYDFIYEKAPVSKLYKDLGLPGTYENNTPTTLRLKTIKQRRTGSEEGVLHHLKWSHMRASDWVDRTALSGTGLDGKRFYSSPGKTWEDCDPSAHNVIGCIERPIHQVWGDFDGDGHIEAMVAPYYVDSKLDDINPLSGEVSNTLSQLQVVQYQQAHFTKPWEMWNFAEGKPFKVDANIKIPNWNWMSTAGISDKDVSLRARPQHNFPRFGVYRDEKAHPAAWSIEYDGNTRTDVLVGVPAVPMGGLFMDPPFGLGSETLTSNTLTDNPPSYCEKWENASEDERRDCRDKVYRKHRSPVDIDGHPGHLSDLKVLTLAPESTPETPIWNEQSLNYPVTANPILWAQPLDLNGDGLTDLAFCKANEDFNLTGDDLVLPMFYSDSQTARYWTRGTLHYALNSAGGFDLSNAGTSFNIDTTTGEVSCDFREAYTVMDLFGDGRQSLLTVEGNFGYNLFGHRYLTSSPNQFPNPENYDEEKLELLHDHYKSMETQSYVAYSLESDDSGVGESMVSKSTNLPLDLFARQAWGASRISTWQTVKVFDGYSGTSTNQPNHVSWNIQEDNPHALRALQMGTYKFMDIGYGPSSGRTGDFNGDGLSDFAVIEHPGNGCKRVSLDDNMVYPRECTLKDITGNSGLSPDGNSMNYSPQPIVAVYFNRGDASFERRAVSRPWDTQDDIDSGTIRNPHFSWNSAQVVDIDKDGVSDIVWLDRTASAVPDGGGCGNGNVCPDGYPSSLISLNVDLLPFYRGVDVAGDASQLSEVKRRRILELHPFVEKYRNDTNDPIAVGHRNTATMSQTELSLKGHGAQVRLFDLDQSGSLDFLVYHNVASEWVYVNGNPIDHGLGQSNPEGETGSPVLNKLVSSRNAMGALTQISYDRLDHRMIEPYTMQDSWQAYPLAYAPRRQSVVGAIKKDNGMGSYQNPDFISQHYYYGKSRFDRLRRLSLGPDRRLGLMHEWTPDGSVTKSRTEYFNNAPNYSQEFRLYPQSGTLQRIVGREYGTQAGDLIRYSHTSSSSPIFGHGTVPGVMWKRSGRTLKSTWEVTGSAQDHNLLYECLESVQDPFVGCDLDEINPNFQPMTLEKSNTTFDELGFPLVANTSSGVGTDERRVVTTIEYDHRIFEGFMPYRLGLLIKENVAEFTLDQGGIPVIRQREFEYDMWGRVERIITDGHAIPVLQVAVEESLNYDARGNILSKTTQGADGVTSSEEVVFESTGVFPMSKINALGMQINLEFWPQCGELRNMTSLAGHTEVTDVFESCDVHATQAFYGDQPLSARTEKQVTNFFLGLHRTTLRKDGVYIGTTEVNRVGQTIETTIGETDGNISIHTFYDRLGRLLGEANPVKEGDPVTHYVSYHYDQFGREVERIKPDGTSLKRLYNRHVVTTIDELAHERIVENDSLGRPVRIEAPQDDLSSDAVCVNYGMLGLATDVGPCEPNSVRSPTEMFYDFRGRLEWMNDAQTGMRYFEYDSFDRLVESTDAEGRKVHHEYDILGRLSTLIEDYGTAEAQTHEWHWDQPFNGALQYASNTENQEWGVYDQFNRQVGRRLRIDDLDLITRSELDDQGRVESTQFPSPAPVGCNDCVVDPLIVEFEYDELDRVVGLYHQNQMIWESGERDIWGNLVEQRFGNDVVARTQYDEVLGRLLNSSVSKETYLDDNIVIDNPIQELSYQWYDNGWLKQRTRHNIGVANSLNQELFDYHANGMLKRWDVTRESDIISQFKSYAMQYDSVGNILSSPMGSYDYQNERLSSVSGTDNNISYAYDANGNTVERVRNGLLSQLVYNARGNVVEVSGVQGNQLIERNINGAKVAVHWQNSGAGDDDIIFKNGFESDVEDLDVDRSTYYAIGFEMERGGALGNKIVARYNLGKAHVVREWHNGLSEPMQETLQYITPPDHLGSTTLVTNTDGGVVDERSYDAWGRERNPNAWNQMLDAPINDVTGFNSGYTGHERRPYGNGLIDMNARYYDPYSYRMVQADSVVPDPTRMEDWNRYVYVRNAPTQYSDPTGHAPSDSAAAVPNTTAFYEVMNENGMGGIVDTLGMKYSASGIKDGGFELTDPGGPDIAVMSDASGESMNAMGQVMNAISREKAKESSVSGTISSGDVIDSEGNVSENSVPVWKQTMSTTGKVAVSAFTIAAAMAGDAIKNSKSPKKRLAKIALESGLFFIGHDVAKKHGGGAGVFDYAGLGYAGLVALGLPASGMAAGAITSLSVGDTLCGGCATDYASYHGLQALRWTNGGGGNISTAVYRSREVNMSTEIIMSMKNQQNRLENSKDPRTPALWNGIEQQIYKEQNRIRYLME